MKLIAAPGRQFKTWSMWMLIAIGIFDLTVVMMHTMGELHVISTQTLAVINAVLVFMTGAARLVHQQIAMTAGQKVDVIESTIAQPLKPGEPEVFATTAIIP